ncbi:putative L-cysteine desulfhydrase 1 [Cryptomeria japonica]|uniref:putative L-cysteine desulfhydrase 1 n=1 Tax=Cryptomeria japonica TaxID=3369 RepID=UPI0025AD3A85|nr:putative L-cysteine desulfhydrase 1 [Cryptomeria japonica]
MENNGTEERAEVYICSGNGGPKGFKRPKTRDENDFDDDEGGFIRREFEHHEKGVARINNGSFGCCPSSVLSAQAKWSRVFMQQPDSFYFNSLQKGILESRQIVSRLINAAHVEEVSLVDNVTTAVAIVLQQVAWAFVEGEFKKGEDAVLMLHYAYGAVKKAIEAYAVRAGAHVIEVHLPFPVSSREEIIVTFREVLKQSKAQSKRIRVAVLDHITSMPSVVLPVKELIKICREEGVDQVFVDGAHAIGSLDIDMQDIGADFYASNLHKWFFCPPPVAFLYCRKQLLPHLHHPVVSSEYGCGLAIESAWVGNRDYSAQLSVPAALEFIEQFEDGIEGIRRKNHDRVIRMAEMLAKAWNTHLGAPPALCSSMAMIGLPDALKVGSEKDALDLRTLLRKKFGVEVPIYYRPPTVVTHLDSTGRPKPAFSAYARISYQIYNTTDDYLKFRDAVNQLVLEASK